MEPKADPRIAVIPDIHGHAKGEHKAFAEERPIPYTARMLFLWFFHACRRSSPRFLMVADHMNYLTFEDPAAVNLVRRALKLAQAGDLYGAAETAGVELGHAAVVSEGLRRGMRYSIGAEIDNDPRCRPDAQNIVDAMKPDGMIRSIHFLPITHPQHGENWMWAFDNPEFKDLYDVVGPANVWEIYMAALLDAIDKLPGNIVGHFYVPAKFGHWPEDRILEEYEDRFVAACAERGMAIEVNSRYFYKYYAGDDAAIARYRAAHLRLLGKAKAANVMIAVGSDAHSPKDQGNAFDTVLALLDEADVNEIAFPISGRLARVALRATDEIIKAHAAALAPPVAARPAPKTDPAAETETDDDDAEELEPAVAAAPAPTHAASAPAPDRVASEPAEVAPSPARPSRPSRSRAKPKPLETDAVEQTPAAVSHDAGTADHAKHDSPAEPAPAPAATPAPKKRSHKKGGGVAAMLAQATETVAAVAAAAVDFVTEAISSRSVTAPDVEPEAARAETAAVPPAAPSPKAAPAKAAAPPKPAPAKPASAKKPAPATPATHEAAPRVEAEAAAPTETAVAPLSERDDTKPSKTKIPAPPAAVVAPAPTSAPAAKTSEKVKAPRSQVVAKPLSPARPTSARASTKAPSEPAKTKIAPKSAAAKTVAAIPARTSAAKPAAKAAAKPAPASKGARPSGPLKKAAKATAKKSSARPSAPKKTAAKKSVGKTAGRTVAKKAPAKRVPVAKKPVAKAAKRPAPAKSVAKKKSAPKKPVAKKKSARARR